MKTIGGDTQTQTESQVAAPFHICKLELPTGEMYISEGKEIIFGGATYLEGALKVGPMSWDESGVQKAQITLMDYTGSAISLVLNNQVADAPATLWLTYGTAGAGFTTPKKLVTGVLDPISISRDEVVLEILAVDINSEFYPDEYCTQENGFNHLPKNGTVVKVGDESFVLERE